MTNGLPKRDDSVLRVLVREPTFHFALLAAALFLANAVLRPRGDETQIEIDLADVEARIELIEQNTGAPLTLEQRQQVQNDYVDEQILVREALALGLEDDPRIHDFLAQKMLHVLSADVIRATQAELEVFFGQNVARYTPEETVVVEEVVIATSDPLPPGLAGQLRNGRPSGQLDTDLQLRANVLSDVTVRDLVGIFGDETGRRVFAAAIGDWTGPHVTVRGQHWLRVTYRTESVPPPLESVREQVRLDWIVEQENVRLRERVAQLRDRYLIKFRGPGN